MFDEIRNFLNNKLKGADWKAPNDNGYIFEDIFPMRTGDII
jgi:hypothetical protein